MLVSAAILERSAGRVRGAEPKWVSLFDGKSLKGWTGNTDFWRVEEGTITGETTPGHMVKGNTFLIWEGGETKGDFELTAEFKLIGGNSGIQYRSYEIPGSRWVCAGYQADMDGADQYTGCIYGERFAACFAPAATKRSSARTTSRKSSDPSAISRNRLAHQASGLEHLPHHLPRLPHGAAN